MLQELLIKDFAIIEEIRIEFAPGLNLITGETGAGKSIIIDALQALLGSKVSIENIREGAKESVIEGTFLVPDPFPLREKYQSLHYLDEDDEQLIVRRIISATGKSRSYLNGNMVNLSALSELSELLLEIHGQNQQISLFKKTVQLFLLDSYAGIEAERFSFEKLYQEWSRVSASLRKVIESDEQARARGSFLKFQVDELESASLEAGEETRLEIEREILSQSEFLKSRSESAFHLLSEDEEHAVLTSLQRIQKDISDLKSVDPKGDPIYQLITSALIQLKEAAVHFRENSLPLGERFV
jgi:DNA repair protein RecN (Recombination protein N)